MSIEEAIVDTDRVNYFRGAFEALHAATFEDGVDIRGYFGWSTFILCFPSLHSLCVTADSLVCLM